MKKKFDPALWYCDHCKRYHIPAVKMHTHDVEVKYITNETWGLTYHRLRLCDEGMMYHALKVASNGR